ncbi:Transposase family tnp2 [Rhizoctonia solani]|uniref:Transposase family tnp2 n=1 Tax=Rhizoctonia solani TaxID=456999 RepID=A0A8H7IK42_9AGAM|nr:Transposase family tnp2 [Rhizoctonia solani]
MPDRRAVTGERVWCYCGINKYGTTPHECHIRTRYRHLAKAQRLDQLLRAGNIEDNEDNAENSENGMDIDHTMHNAHQYEDRGGDLGLRDNSFNDIDAYMGAHLDSKLSESEDSHADWHNIDNPVCIPLQTPTPPPNDEEPPDEDGFAHITEEDYCDAETLTEEEMDSIKMMAIRLFGHILQRNYKCIRLLFFLGYPLNQLTAASTSVTHSLDPTPTRIYALHGYFNNLEMIKRMYYRANYTQEEGWMDDYIDLQRYKDLCESNIIVEGEDLGVRYFHGSCDIAYAVMTDGVNLFSRRILRKPKDFDSYLEPFVEEAIEQARGVETYNVTRRETVQVTGPCFSHFGRHAGNQARDPNERTKRQGSLLRVQGHWSDYPNAIPDGRPDPQDFPPNTIPLYNPLDLPLRTKARIADQLGEMDAANTKRQRDALSKNYGLINHLILNRIPSICWPDLYPHEYLHLFLLNHGRELISLWTGSCHGIDDSGDKDYLISADDWAAIGLETEEASKHYLPHSFDPCLTFRLAKRFFAARLGLSG